MCNLRNRRIPYSRKSIANELHLAQLARSASVILLAIVMLLTSCVSAAKTEMAARATNPAITSTATVMPSVTPASTRPPIPALSPTITSRRTPTPFRTPTRRPTATRAATLSSTNTKPSKVELRHVGNTFALIVNGRPTFVKGLNYNVNYTALDEETQWRLHRRDFQIMRDAGVNVIVGWGIYDEITLQVAQEFGIGVIMPFDLSPQGAYENENYREQMKDEFREYVKRFRDFPAVWGWNPGGDELLYRMRTEENRTPDKLQAAADFELELVNLAYSLDPNHISLIKEPRDWYLKYLYESFQKAKTQPGYPDPSGFLMYGVNIYGKLDDIETVLTNTRNSIDAGLGLAMIVSEFSPLFLPRSDRPQNYAAIWDIALRISGIGACAYVFGPDQPNPDAPNPYDPLKLLPSEYSMVDINGTPIDNSLAALAAKWRALGTPTPYPSATPTVRTK